MNACSVIRALKFSRAKQTKSKLFYFFLKHRTDKYYIDCHLCFSSSFNELCDKCLRESVKIDCNP
jgi:hypothetical protein